MTSVLIWETDAPPVNQAEILRYAGAASDDTATVALMQDCLREAEGVLSWRVCYMEIDADGLAFMSSLSSAFRKYIDGCKKAVLFAATVGIGMDRLIARYNRLSPSRALMMQSIGSERVEALCDAFCRDLAESKRRSGAVIKPRFSPGYGDLPLAVQSRVFDLLDCPRRIGVSLNESLLMIPTKSVTAVVGVVT